MTNRQLFIFVQLIVVVFFFQGMAMVGLKQLSRNNLNEETITANIIPCQTSREEVIKLYRAPTDDFMRKQGDYDVYIYKGYAGRTKVGVNVLEVLINNDGLVVNYRFNNESVDDIDDICH